MAPGTPGRRRADLRAAPDASRSPGVAARPPGCASVIVTATPAGATSSGARRRACGLPAQTVSPRSSRRSSARPAPVGGTSTGARRRGDQRGRQSAHPAGGRRPRARRRRPAGRRHAARAALSGTVRNYLSAAVSKLGAPTVTRPWRSPAPRLDLTLRRPPVSVATVPHGEGRRVRGRAGSGSRPVRPGRRSRLDGDAGRAVRRDRTPVGRRAKLLHAFTTDLRDVGHRRRPGLRRGRGRPRPVDRSRSGSTHRRRRHGHVRLLLVGIDAAARRSRRYTYADSRCSAFVEPLRERLDEASVQQRTGTRVHTSYQAPRLLWLHETQPELAGRVVRWLARRVLQQRLLGTTAASKPTAAWTGCSTGGPGMGRRAARRLPRRTDLSPVQDRASRSRGSTRPGWPATAGAGRRRVLPRSRTACRATWARVRPTRRRSRRLRRRAVPSGRSCGRPRGIPSASGATGSTLRSLWAARQRRRTLVAWLRTTLRCRRRRRARRAPGR